MLLAPVLGRMLCAGVPALRSDGWATVNRQKMHSDEVDIDQLLVRGRETPPICRWVVGVVIGRIPSSALDAQPNVRCDIVFRRRPRLLCAHAPKAAPEQYGIAPGCLETVNNDRPVNAE